MYPKRYRSLFSILFLFKEYFKNIPRSIYKTYYDDWKLLTRTPLRIAWMALGRQRVQPPPWPDKTTKPPSSSCKARIRSWPVSAYNKYRINLWLWSRLCQHRSQRGKKPWASRVSRFPSCLWAGAATFRSSWNHRFDKPVL